jgi:hypothetical protein
MTYHGEFVILVARVLKLGVMVGGKHEKSNEDA